MTVRESSWELFEMNYLEFEGLMNELGNYGPKYEKHM